MTNNLKSNMGNTFSGKLPFERMNSTDSNFKILTGVKKFSV